jgi:putative transposase
MMSIYLVSTTKYHFGVFTKAPLNDLRVIFFGVFEDFEAKLVEFDGESAQVHLLVLYPPIISMYFLVNTLN